MDLLSLFLWLRRLSELLLPTAWPHKISGQMLSSHSIVSSFKTVKLCSPWGGRWIGHWRTTSSTVCSFAPHSQTAEEAIPHLYKQEWKRPTSVRRCLSRTTALLGRAIPGGWEPVSGIKVRTLVVLSNHSTFGDPPERRTSIIVDIWTDELLCGEYKWLSRFEAPCIPSRWTGEQSRRHGPACWRQCGCLCGTTQRSIELQRGSTTSVNKSCYSALKQKLWQNTRYLQLCGMNDWLYFDFLAKLALRGNENICSTVQYLQAKIYNATTFVPTWLHAWQQWLMAVWFWFFCCDS